MKTLQTSSTLIRNEKLAVLISMTQRFIVYGCMSISDDILDLWKQLSEKLLGLFS